jgi:hypothetical protein
MFPSCKSGFKYINGNCYKRKTAGDKLNSSPCNSEFNICPTSAVEFEVTMNEDGIFLNTGDSLLLTV